MSMETVVFIYACAILISAYGIGMIGVILYRLARIIIEDIKAKKEKRHDR